VFLFLPLRLPIDIYIYIYIDVDVVSVLWQSKQRADTVARVPIEIPVRI
jgi:hypothetical protein